MDSETKTLFDGGSAATIERMASGEASSTTPLRVGRYFISRQIAEGGMGRVLLGYDETLSRKLAIKLWRPQASRGEDLRARMLREAQALARLSHPNVVHVYEVGDHRDLLYLAMEYVEGRTLREWVKQDRPELPRIVERYVQAGQGLAAAHRAGVLHRDFKPESGLASQVVENTSVPRLRRWCVPIVYQAGRPRQDRAARVRSERPARSRTRVTGIGARRKESTQP